MFLFSLFPHATPQFMYLYDESDGFIFLLSLEVFSGVSSLFLSYTRSSFNDVLSSSHASIPRSFKFFTTYCIRVCNGPLPSSPLE